MGKHYSRLLKFDSQILTIREIVYPTIPAANPTLSLVFSAASPHSPQSVSRASLWSTVSFILKHLSIAHYTPEVYPKASCSPSWNLLQPWLPFTPSSTLQDYSCSLRLCQEGSKQNSTPPIPIPAAIQNNYSFSLTFPTPHCSLSPTLCRCQKRITLQSHPGLHCL